VVRSSVDYPKQRQIRIKMMASARSIKSFNDRSCKNDEASYDEPAGPKKKKGHMRVVRGFY